MSRTKLLVDKLTPEQEVQLVPMRDQWLRAGLSTEPADRAKAQAAAVAAYEAAGLKAPTLFIWLDSPIAGCFGASFLSQVGAQVRAQVVDQVGAQVGAQVRAQVVDQVWDLVRDQVWAQINRSCWGQHDSGWLSFYCFFRDVCSLESARRLSGLISVAESAGWWWPFAGAVVFTERPRHLSRDDRGRLHCMDRAAIEYPDGWGVYAWHGVRVPAHVITDPASITVAQIEAEQNAEIRRVMIERYGQSRYLLDSGAKQVHRDKVGVLYRKEIPGDEPLCMVKVRNSTPEPDGSVKDYFLRVPSQVETARAAVAWTFGVDAKDYRPEVET